MFPNISFSRFLDDQQLHIYNQFCLFIAPRKYSVSLIKSEKNITQFKWDPKREPLKGEGH